MAKAKITSKGQVTVPKEVRERLGIRPGDVLEFREERGVYLVSKHLAPETLSKYRGYLEKLEGQDPDELVEQMRGK